MINDVPNKLSMKCVLNYVDLNFKIISMLLAAPFFGRYLISLYLFLSNIGINYRGLQEFNISKILLI